MTSGTTITGQSTTSPIPSTTLPGQGAAAAEEAAAAAEAAGIVWLPWQEWSACSGSCGTGTQTRFRECNNTQTTLMDCIGDREENTTCTLDPCHCTVDSTDHNGFTIDSDGFIVIFNVGDIVTEGTVIHRDCSECECIGTNWTCLPTECQYCRYTDWEQWSDCTQSCDVGMRSRSRQLLPIQDLEKCVLCDGSREELEDCNTQTCSGWSTWLPWSGCSVTESCTFGIRTRTRVCTGTGCEGDRLEIEPCGESCDEFDSNCSGDTIYTNCASHIDQTCGGLSNFYTEMDVCEGGCVCKPGFLVPNKSGNCIPDSSCPCYTDDGQSVPQGQSLVKGCMTCHCNGTNQQLDCTTNTSCCDWGTWSSWGSCDMACGSGTKQRYRDLISGEDCGPAIETEDCVTDCPSDCVVNGNEYHCGNITSANSTHTCYCTVGNGSSCVQNIPSSDNCLNYTKKEILYDAVGYCRSVEEVSVDYCAGSCGNSTFETVLVFSSDSDGGQSVNCPCCQGTFYDEKEEIQVICGPEKVLKVAYVPRIKECSCKPCSGATSVSLPTTTVAVR